MMRVLFLLTGMFMGMAACAEGYTDNEIVRMLYEANGVIDAPGRSGRMARGILENACNSDTGRFCRIVSGVATSNDMWISRWMVSLLGAYGGREQLPLLYSLATNANTCVSACKSMVRIEGLTTNSLAAIGACLAVTNIDARLQTSVCENALLYAKESGVAGVLRTNLFERCQAYAASNTSYVVGLDESLVDFDAAYRVSKRRLSVLRLALERGTSPYQRNYVTNAINELVAYPESALPE